MGRSWLDKISHTGEEVEAARLLKSLNASRDALRIERDNALAEVSHLRGELATLRASANGLIDALPDTRRLLIAREDLIAAIAKEHQS